MKAYIAGPFFTEKERNYLNEMIAFVRKRFPHYELFIPMDHFIPDGDKIDNNTWGNLVFNMDVKALDDSDIVIALYLGHYSDTGTAWEIGYAYAKKKPTFLYIPEDIKENVSIMPIQSGIIITNNNNLNQK